MAGYKKDFLNSWQCKDALSRLTYKDGRLYRYGKPIACTLDSAGYRILSLAGRVFKEHRVVWYKHHGEWPEGDIDHIDQDKLNNRIENLRVVSKSVNSHNIAQANKNSKSGVRGISPYRGKWRASIDIRGKNKYLGLFDTIAEAKEAYDKAKQEVNTDNEGTGN